MHHHHGNHAIDKYGNPALDKYGNPALDKWKFAFDASNKGGVGGHHHHHQMMKPAAPTMMEDFEEGFLNVNRMLVGTKILFFKVRMEPLLDENINRCDS